MKRFLALFAVLVLCISLFAACKPADNPDDTTTSTTPSGEEATLADAAAYLFSLYKDGAESTERDYDVVAKIMIGATVFEVTWTVDVDSIQIVKSEKEGFWTVDLPSKADEEIVYTLTATIKDAAGNVETRTFKRKVPVMDNSLLVTDPQEGVAYKFFMKQASIGLTLFATGEMDGEKYLASSTDAKSAPDFYIEKVDGGVKIYTELNGKKMYVNAYTVTADDGKESKYLTYAESTDSVWTYDAEVNAWCTTIGKTEYVVGTYSTYKTFCISEKSYISAANSGVSQFPAGFADKAAAEALDPNAGVTVYTTPAEIVKAAYALEPGKVLSAGYLYTLTGVITKVNTPYDSGYGNVTVTIVVDGMTDYPIECFRLKGDGADKIKKGDTITVKGELLMYDNTSSGGTGKVEFNSGCTLVSYKSTGAVEQKFENAEIKPVKPVAGKAYKVVFVQENQKSTAYFMTGAMSGYYGESTTVETEAADVYVETTTGGYYIYAKVGGEKVYVGTVKSADGAHINFTLGGEKTVYTWNADKQTMVTTIDDVTYAFGGTYNTYTTFSPQDISKDGFLAHFVVEGTTTGTTVEEEAPVAPEATDTFKEGTAYKMFIEQVTLNSVLYAIGEADSDKYIKTTTKVSEAVDFFVEKSGSGYKIYYKNGSKKVYLNARTETNDGKTSKFLFFQESTGSVFTYDKTLGMWFVTVDGADYGVGTYSSYNTISISDASYYTASTIGTSQFVLQFVESSKAPADDGDEDEGGDSTEKPATLAEQIAAAEKLADNEALPYESTITGTITDDPAASSYTAGSYKFTVSDGTNSILCYYVPVTGGTPKKGDTITVTGKLSAFGGNAQFKEGNATAVLGGSSTGGSGNEGGNDTAPVEENIAYKLYINQVSASKEVYATDTISSGKYIATTTDAAAGVDFYAEKVTGGWKFYTTIDGAKMYLHSWLEGTSKYIGYTAESDVVYVYDAEVNAWCTAIDGTDYFVGTYNTYDTVSLSAKSFINASNTGVTQFPAEFVTVSGGEGGGSTGGSGNEGGNDGGNTPTYTTPEEILKAAYALENGATLGNYTLTGVITSVNDPFSTQWNNVTVTMVVDGLSDYPIVAFRMKGTGMDVIKVGDTITVTGSIMKYTDGTVEFNSGCTLDSYVAGTTPDEGGDGVGGGDATEGTTAEMDIFATAGTLASDSSRISWTGEGFTFVTEQSSSTNAIRVTDADHFRAYKGTKTIISSTNGKKITKIEITSTAATGDYSATVLSGCTFSAGTVSVSDKIVTITFATPVDALEIVATAQWRLNHIAVTFEGATAGGDNVGGGEDVGGGDDSGNGDITEGATVEKAIISNQGTFDSSAKKITWTASGFTFVNEQYNSSTGIRTTDTDHFRVYASSKVTIAATDGKKITKIVITCTSSSYATALAACQFSAGTAVADGSVVTITFSSAVDSVAITNGAQWRLNNVAVTFAA